MKPADMESARALQDRIEVRQSDGGKLEMPDWDPQTLGTIRAALTTLAATADLRECFGDKTKLDPIAHLLGTAYGWGGNPRRDAIYDSVTPAQNDGSKPHVLRVRDVPVDGFWSVTVYNAKGFMEKNGLDAYSVNGITAVPDADGGATIHFGGDPKSSNYLPITPGWNYTVRMYRPKKAALEDNWKFPAARPMR
jgi:hypothetical protein